MSLVRITGHHDACHAVRPLHVLRTKRRELILVKRVHLPRLRLTLKQLLQESAVFRVEVLKTSTKWAEPIALLSATSERKVVEYLWFTNRYGVLQLKDRRRADAKTNDERIIDGTVPGH